MSEMWKRIVKLPRSMSELPIDRAQIVRCAHIDPSQLWTDWSGHQTDIIWDADAAALTIPALSTGQGNVIGVFRFSQVLNDGESYAFSSSNLPGPNVAALLFLYDAQAQIIPFKGESGERATRPPAFPTSAPRFRWWIVNQAWCRKSLVANTMRSSTRVASLYRQMGDTWHFQVWSLSKSREIRMSCGDSSTGNGMRSCTTMLKDQLPEYRPIARTWVLT